VRGLAAFDHAGYRVRVMPNVHSQDWEWVSGTASERASDLMTAFVDAEVRAIICAIGGDPRSFCRCWTWT